MNHHEFDEKFGMLVRNERRSTNAVLQMINRCEESRRYLYLSYSSLFDWLVRGHGYSESAAYRRIEGARLLKAVPETAAQLESGQVNLTQLAKVQSIVRAEEKVTKRRVSQAEKVEAINAVKGKTKLDGERQLLGLFAAAQSEISRDRAQAINPEQVRLSFNLPKEVMNDLNRAKEILSHAVPDGSMCEILRRVLKEFLNRRDPLRRPSKVRLSDQVVRF